MAAHIQMPGVAPFQCHGDPNQVSQNWEKWKKAFQYFLGASGITNDARKKAILSHMIGLEGQEIFETLSPTGDSYEHALEALSDHFSVRKNIPFERSVFHQAKQKPGESVEQFVTRLRRLASTCEYGNQTSEQIRDQVIAACSSSKLRKRLLTEADLTLDQTLQIAQSLESAHHHTKEIETNSVPRNTEENKDEEYLNYLKWKQRQQTRHHQAPRKAAGIPNKSVKTCSRCGAKGHTGNECRRSKDAECHNCGKKGHLQKMCRSPAKQNAGQKWSKPFYKQESTRCVQVHQDESPATDDDDDYIYVFSINGPKSALFTVKIGTQSFQMLIDSGSTANILDKTTFNQLVPQPVLKPSTAQIFPYQATEKLTVLGTFKARVTTISQSTVVKFYVIQGSAGAILGKTSAEELNLLQVGPPVSEPPTVASLAQQPSPETQAVVDKHPDVFSGLGKLRNVQLKLHIDPNIVPIQQPIRRIPFHTRQRVSEELKRLQDLDIIERVSGPTSWVNPIVVVTKSNGKTRLCLDMRQANQAIIREHHVIPKIDDILAELHGAQIFSKIDLREGYHQIELHPESRDITTFVTHEGLFRYKRLIFGVNSAFEIFQKKIEQVIAGCDGSKNISDDILIWGSTQEEHDKNLCKVLTSLKNSGLKVNPDKCIFGANDITFAGHELSAKGIVPQQSRIDSIKQIAPPTNAKQVRSFLGMVNFVNKFIKDFSTITAPLRLLTRKNQQFYWGSKQQAAFDTLKASLTGSDVMAYYDPEAHTTAHC